MSEYIRLPRDSEENDRRAIGANSDNNSLHSNMAFLSDYTMRTASVEPFLRFLGGTFAISSLITISIAYNATGHGVAPAALFACTAAVLINLPMVAWFVLQRIAKKIATCEDCKTRIMNYVPTNQMFLRFVDGVISLMSFITSIMLMAIKLHNWRYYAFRQVTVAGGILLLALSFVHGALLATSITSRVKIEVRFVRMRSGQSTPAPVPSSPRVTSQVAQDAPEAQPLATPSYADADVKV